MSTKARSEIKWMFAGIVLLNICLLILSACGGGGGGAGQGGNSLDCADTVNINVTIDQHQVLDPTGEFTQPNFSPTVAGDNTVNIDACNFDNGATNDDSTTVADNSQRSLTSAQSAYQERLNALLAELNPPEAPAPADLFVAEVAENPVIEAIPYDQRPKGDPSICVNDYEYNQSHDCRGAPAPDFGVVSPAPDSSTINPMPGSGIIE